MLLLLVGVKGSCSDLSADGLIPEQGLGQKCRCSLAIERHFHEPARRFICGVGSMLLALPEGFMLTRYHRYPASDLIDSARRERLGTVELHP